MDLYNKTSLGCSKLFTQKYSTSFSKAVSLLDISIQDDIYSIYGFVRVADEIVDTFHQYPKQEMLSDLRNEVFRALKTGISTNPIINSFQLVVNKYNIPHELITSFLDSMEMDLEKKAFTSHEYSKYIYGSAEVVGLMCLKVFSNGNESECNNLRKPAQSLGEAFQKVNFLRDVKDDFAERGRVYFPNINFENFADVQKRQIEQDITNDLKQAYLGIKMLPRTAQLGVYVAYLYFKALLSRIKKVKANRILQKRIRVPNWIKFLLMLKARLAFGFRLI
ncbi:MAG TPA: phytoene/squalene synthase family protein [Bacteroidetes bacterium]|nr:phytoene/squalene synthase family protein [Bacteroidota bacterium]